MFQAEIFRKTKEITSELRSWRDAVSCILLSLLIMGTLGGEVLCGLILGGITGAATYGAITGKALIDILKN